MDSICMSLKEREDKREAVVDEFEKLGVTPAWFIANKQKVGWQGCRDSHLRCMEIMRRCRTFMILEDDILCLTDNPKDDLYRIMLGLPMNWDALWLGSNLQKPLERYSDKLFKLAGGWTTHAIIWNNRRGVIDYILEHRNEVNKIDVFFANVIQEKFNCFITYPMLITQRQYKSDVCKTTNAAKILENYNKFTK